MTGPPRPILDSAPAPASSARSALVLSYATPERGRPTPAVVHGSVSVTVRAGPSSRWIHTAFMLLSMAAAIALGIVVAIAGHTAKIWNDDAAGIVAFSPVVAGGLVVLCLGTSRRARTIVAVSIDGGVLYLDRLGMMTALTFPLDDVRDFHVRPLFFGIGSRGELCITLANGRIHRAFRARKTDDLLSAADSLNDALRAWLRPIRTARPTT